MTVATIKLPWPRSALSPNARHGHWGGQRRATNSYRDASYLSVLEQKVRKPSGRTFDVLLVFVPPDRRHYDRDNLVGRCKHGLDGIALAWGINDNAFVRVAGEIRPAVVPARGAAHVRVEVYEHLETWTIRSGPDGLPASIGIAP